MLARQATACFRILTVLLWRWRLLIRRIAASSTQVAGAWLRRMIWSVPSRSAAADVDCTGPWTMALAGWIRCVRMGRLYRKTLLGAPAYLRQAALEFRVSRRW